MFKNKLSKEERINENNRKKKENPKKEIKDKNWWVKWKEKNFDKEKWGSNVKRKMREQC